MKDTPKSKGENLKRKNVVSVIGVLLIATSCNSYQFVNQMPQEPMFQKQWEVTASGGFGLRHADLQCGLSVAPSFGITSNNFVSANAFSREINGVFFSPIKESEAKTTFLSLTVGSVNAAVNRNVWSGYDRRISDVTYSGINAQMSVYNHNRLRGVSNALSLKIVAVDYHRFFYEKRWEDDGNYGRVERFTISGRRRYNCATLLYTHRRNFGQRASFYFLTQLGVSLRGNLDNITRERMDWRGSAPGPNPVFTTSEQLDFLPAYHVITANLGIGFRIAAR